MRKIVAVALCALVSAAVATGCAKKKTYSTPEGKVTVTERGSGEKSEVTIESEEGKVEIRGDEESMKITSKEGTYEVGKQVTEQEIGLPFYPGAKPEGSSSWTGEGEKGRDAFAQIALTTPDSVNEVKAFYTKRLPKAKTALEATSQDAHVVQMVLEEGNLRKMVNIVREKDAKETQITLQKVQKGK